MYWVIGLMWVAGAGVVIGYAVKRARQERRAADRDAKRGWDAFIEARRNYLRHEEDRD
jgi:hypothetical protein